MEFLEHILLPLGLEPSFGYWVDNLQYQSVEAIVHRYVELLEEVIFFVIGAMLDCFGFEHKGIN